jgi:Ca-activated chloride channel homolog
MKNYILFFFLLFLAGSCDKYNDGYMPGDPSNDNFGAEKYGNYGENAFIKTNNQPISTFGIDADGGSYSNTRRFLTYGQKPPSEAVRVEEFINYFTYDYPAPENGYVGINSEIAKCPWNSEHYLLRIGLRGSDQIEEISQFSNFVFLIDVSGSMQSSDKLELLKTGFKLFAQELTENDRIAIVTYAGSASVLLPSTLGLEKDKIIDAINSLSAGGSTAGAQGLMTAYEIAQENFIAKGNNRIILGTDGDFNVGVSSNSELIRMIEEKRNSGIYLTILGVGTGNLNESMMEQLADKGNGNYEYIDNVKQMDKIFIYDYSRFFTVAKDCKIQVVFDTVNVDSYRLIGYENRIINNDDFGNDSADAGEIGAGQTITALYELVLTNNSNTNQLASVNLRYKIPTRETSNLIETEVTKQNTEFSRSSENMRFAASVAGFGMMLKNSEYKGTLTYENLIDWSEASRSFDPHGLRQEFVDLLRAAGTFD